MMPTYLPTVRNSAGRSLGPMTSSATMPRINSLLEVKSNIGSTLWRAHKPVLPEPLLPERVFLDPVFARTSACPSQRPRGRPSAPHPHQVLAPHPALLGSTADCCSLGLPPAPSKTLGGSSFLAGSSSSAMPFLKLLMPLATSPMIEEILPLPPNISRATAKNSSQCQTLRLPISLSLPLCSRSCTRVFVATIAETTPAGKVTTPVLASSKRLNCRCFEGHPALIFAHPPEALRRETRVRLAGSTETGPTRWPLMPATMRT